MQKWQRVQNFKLVWVRNYIYFAYYKSFCIMLLRLSPKKYNKNIMAFYNRKKLYVAYNLHTHRTHCKWKIAHCPENS